MQTQTLSQKLQTGGLGLNLKGHFVCSPRVTMLVQTEKKVFILICIIVITQIQDHG